MVNQNGVWGNVMRSIRRKVIKKNLKDFTLIIHVPDKSIITEKELLFLQELGYWTGTTKVRVESTNSNHSKGWGEEDNAKTHLQKWKTTESVLGRE